MKKIMRNFLCTAGSVCVLLYCGTAFPGVVDKVIVVINDEVITQREFDKAFGPVKQSIEANFTGQELEDHLGIAQKQMLEQMINTKLIVSLAKAQKIEINEDELSEKLGRIKAYYSSEDEFLRALSAKGTNLTEFEKEFREQMLGQELVEKEVASKIVITPAEIRSVYEGNKEKFVFPKRVKLRGIMVRKAGDESGDKEARGKMEEIISDLKKGRVFESLAKERSEGPYAENGGDMGWVSPGEILPEIDEVVFSMNKGDVSGIVETNVGYHVFLVEDIEDPRDAKFAEVSDFIRSQIYRAKFEESLVKWIEGKRKHAYISYK